MAKLTIVSNRSPKGAKPARPSRRIKYSAKEVIALLCLLSLTALVFYYLGGI